MNYAELIAADLRLVILQALEQDPDYSHNDSVINAVLGAVGHAISRDRVRTELHWLAEQGLIRVTDMSGVLVAKLTGRGVDVALGYARVPGVARPRPEA